MATDLAEPWHKGNASLRFLQHLSDRIEGAVYSSLMIKTKSGFANRGVFVTPSGEMAYYDKRKTFKMAGEDQFYTEGKREKIVHYKGWKINLQICFDLRFPELVRNKCVLGQPKYDLLLYVANWPEKRIAHWDALLQARAIENQCIVVGVNRVGVDGNQHVYCGNSKLVGIDGSILWQAETNKECTASCTLNPETLVEYRKKLAFLE
jgi:predicted amidohydrolase